MVQSLVDKSFVRPLADGRFDLLVSVQDYAAERLEFGGPYLGGDAHARQSAMSRHCAWFAALGPKRAVEGACAELANLVVACRRAILRTQAQQAVGALNGAWAALSRHGPFSTGIELAEAVCSLNVLDDREAACAHAVYGKVLDSLGHPSAAREHYSVRPVTCPRM